MIPLYQANCYYVGDYNPIRIEPVSVRQCLPCDSSCMICTAEAWDAHLPLRPVAGWWQGHLNSPFIYQCRVAEACNGYDAQACASGYEGKIKFKFFQYDTSASLVPLVYISH